MIYLDHAATSHPKPETVYAAVAACLQEGGNPGRGGHRLSLAAARRIHAARTEAAGLFGVADSSRIVFTASATEAINLALKGLLNPGDHVVTSAAEHNAVVRPLRRLAETGVSVTRVPVGHDGLLDPAAVRAACTPATRMLVFAHASNVSGALQPLADLAEVARAVGALLLVDAAQTAGSRPIDVGRLGVHLLAAPGHKGLLGPQGTGLLYVDSSLALRPLKEGGTGGMAEQEIQPDLMPEGLESGTPNTPGLAGLAAGMAYVRQNAAQITAHEQRLTEQLSAGLARIRGVTLYGPEDPSRRASVVSFNLAGTDAVAVSEALDDEFGVLGRAGLHCAPAAHCCLGSLAQGGAMRLSAGPFNTLAEIDAAVTAVAELARRSTGVAGGRGR